MRDLSNFELAEGMLNVEIDVRLDWIDKQLKERIHYYMDPRSGLWQLSNAVAADDDFLFNPSVYLDNALECDLLEHDSDTIPRITGMCPCPEAIDGEAPWLTK